jgi:hypothetical protein
MSEIKNNPGSTPIFPPSGPAATHEPSTTAASPEAMFDARAKALNRAVTAAAMGEPANVEAALAALRPVIADAAKSDAVGTQDKLESLRDRMKKLVNNPKNKLSRAERNAIMKEFNVLCPAKAKGHCPVDKFLKTPSGASPRTNGQPPAQQDLTQPALEPIPPKLEPIPLPRSAALGAPASQVGVCLRGQRSPGVLI